MRTLAHQPKHTLSDLCLFVHVSPALFAASIHKYVFLSSFLKPSNLKWQNYPSLINQQFIRLFHLIKVIRSNKVGHMHYLNMYRYDICVRKILILSNNVSIKIWLLNMVKSLIENGIWFILLVKVKTIYSFITKFIKYT